MTFGAPPVNEVAFAVQFAEPVIDLDVLTDFSRSLKETFPEKQQQPPLPRMIEPVERLGQPQVQIQFGITSFPRTWLLSQDGHRLIQVQSDRIVFNWRLLAGEQPYPRYTVLSGEFANLLEGFARVIEASDKPNPTVDFCEVSYVNEIVVPGIEPGHQHPDLSEILTIVSEVKGRRFLPKAEDAQFQARWRIDNDALPTDSPIGRLYLSVTPGYRAATQLPIYAMTLASRIVPAPGTDLSASLSFIDVGHEWIVRGFADITTDNMHEVWQLTEST